MNHHEQDMRHYGGLRRLMPWTCAAMTISAAAMAGVPPLSGFFSKDEILWSAFSTGSVPGRIAWILGMVGALCTGFYMFRLIFMTFGGKYRGHHHPHEAPRMMTIPQGVLAAGAMVVGFLAVPHVLGGHNAFAHYLEPVIPEWARHSAGEHAAPSAVAVEWALMSWSVLIGLAGISAAWWMYVRRPELPAQFVAKIPRMYRLVHERFRVDEAYQGKIVDPAVRLADGFLHKRVDRGFIDGIVNGLGRGFTAVSSACSVLQSGFVRHYIAVMVGGILLMLLSLLSFAG
jgi:NADH-quinone oxidoreductase subunit L